MSDLKKTFSRIFEPKSVAFIGATDTPGKWGFTILLHILQGGYQGKLYLVNPKRESVMGHPCLNTIEEIPETPDVAVIVVPAKYVLATMDKLIAKGVKACVVISSGFAESNEEGKDLQKKLVKKARENGVRLVGPNSMGIFTAFPDRLVSFMASIMPEPGNLAIIAQSGNLGVSLMARSLRRGIGVSRVVSVGNESDLTIADYLNMMADDDMTKVVSVYAEGATNGRELLEAIENVAKKKPITLLKGGRSEFGKRAVSSHTAALSGSYDIFKAAVQEAGAVVEESMDDMINNIGTFLSQPIPKSNKTAVFTLGGGWGVLATDACARYGLDMPKLPESLIESIGAELPDYWSKGNPIDMVATTNPMLIPDLLEMLLKAEEYDNLIYLGYGYLSYGGTRYLEKVEGIGQDLSTIAKLMISTEKNMSDRLLDLAKKYNKPLLPVTDLHVRDLPDDINLPKSLEKSGLFVHDSPSHAAHALAALCERSSYLARAENAHEAPDFNHDNIDSAKKTIAKALEKGTKQLTEHQSKDLLRAVGVPCPTEKEVSSLDEAKAAAKEIGYPLVLKVSASDIIHKSDADGVVLNVSDDDTLKKETKRLLELGNVLVQQMTGDHPTELLVGIKQDPSFGSVLTFGKGGVETEVWRDSYSLPAPVSKAQANRIIQKTKVSKLLGEFRGREAYDMDKLIDTIIKISHLPELFPEISELDINPLFIDKNGVMAVDAAIILK